MNENKVPETEISLAKENEKNKYGQYFTPKIVAEFMVDLATLQSSSKILEPSAGEGVFLDVLKSKGYKNVNAYEIDKELCKQFDFVKYESFVSANVKTRFDLIIGNPPYIRWKNLEPELKKELTNNTLWKKYFNSLCDYLYIFILKSIELLNDQGQLIFICPEYWMNTTHSISLRNYMVENGYFEEIFHFNETPIFNGATVSVVVFKFIKGVNKSEKIKIAKYYKNKPLTTELLEQLKENTSKNIDIESFSVPQFEKNKRWLLTNQNEIDQINKFETSCSTEIKHSFDIFDENVSKSYSTIGDICDIGNGMVSGLDKAFQINGVELNEFEAAKSIKVIKAKNLEPYIYNEKTTYIFTNDVKTENEFINNYPNFYSKLVGYREKLNKRYQYNRDINYWEWVFLRNYKLFSSNNDRIFVPCKERISNKDYFRFSYVSKGIYPTQDVTAIFKKKDTNESLYYILAFLNNSRVFMWLKNKGIVKGNIVEFSEKPISSIPYRKIDWNNKNEVEIHNQITKLSKTYLQDKVYFNLEMINQLFDKLLK
jgi:adenine-specific DNA-methyltransferase